MAKWEETVVVGSRDQGRRQDRRLRVPPQPRQDNTGEECCDFVTELVPSWEEWYELDEQRLRAQRLEARRIQAEIKREPQESSGDEIQSSHVQTAIQLVAE